MIRRGIVRSMGGLRPAHGFGLGFALAFALMCAGGPVLCHAQDGAKAPEGAQATGAGASPGTAENAPPPAQVPATGAVPGSNRAGAETPEGRFRAAGEAYEAGRYEEAASLYQGLLEDGFDDARIHYNLGNARFKQGRLGPAILSYERALARNPSDPDISENLAFANLLTSDKVGSLEEDFPTRVLGALGRRFSPERAVRWFALLILVAGALGVPLWFGPAKGWRRVLLAGVAVCLAGAAIAGGIAALEVASPGHESFAVVLAPSTDGRSSPAADGTVLFTVHEGLKVEVRGERSGWIQVALPNGLAGWIESSHAERI